MFLHHTLCDVARTRRGDLSRLIRKKVMAADRVRTVAEGLSLLLSITLRRFLELGRYARMYCKAEGNKRVMEAWRATETPSGSHPVSYCRPDSVN